MIPRLRFWTALLASIAALAAGVFMSRRTGDWTWLSRTGALVVIIGAVVAAWDSIRAGNSALLFARHLFSKERMPSESLGLALMVLGTLTWAFGDLLGDLLVAP